MTTDRAPESGGLIALHRTSAMISGGVVGGFAGAIAAVALGSDSSVLLAWVLGGGVVGAAVGAFWPVSVAFPAPPIVPGQPVPQLALGHVFADRLGRATAKGLRLGTIIALGALPVALGVSAVVGQRPSALVLGGLAIASYVAAIVCSTVLSPFLLDERTRRAFAVMSWQGAREFEQEFGSKRAAAKFPVTAEAGRVWLEENLRWDAIRPVHVEVMMMVGDFEAARSGIERLPTTTPRERFAKAELEALVRYQSTGDMDRSAVRAALAAIPPGIEHVEAAAVSAITEARMRLPDGDWHEPLLAVRDAIPESDTVILIRDDGWVRLTMVLAAIWPLLLLFVGVVVAGVVL